MFIDDIYIGLSQEPDDPAPDGICGACGGDLWEDAHHGYDLWCATCNDYTDDAPRCGLCDEAVAPGYCGCDRDGLLIDPG